MKSLECPVCHYVSDDQWDLAAHAGHAHMVLVQGFYYRISDGRFVLNKMLNDDGVSWRCLCGTVRKNMNGIITHLYVTGDVAQHLIDGTLDAMAKVGE